MGIQDLYQVIYTRAPEVIKIYHLSEFYGYRFAVDISIFLNKYVKSAGETQWMELFFLFLCTLKKHGIKTVCVFDGPNPPPEKAREQERRRAEGRKAADRLEKCMKMRDKLFEEYIPFNQELSISLQNECKGLIGDTKRLTRQPNWSECGEVFNVLRCVIERLEKVALPITNKHKEKAKMIADMMGLPIFQAHGEAEALCAYMALHNYVDAVLTEDTDVLVYGTPWMVAFKDLKLTEERVYGINLEHLRDSLGYTQKELLDLCILLGCDYNKRAIGYPPDGKKRKKPIGIGLKGALAMIDEYRCLEEVEKHLTESEQLIWQRCREIFTPPSGQEAEEIIKMIPDNRRPDIDAIKTFIASEGLNVSIEYIEKCWRPSSEIVFHDID